MNLWGENLTRQALLQRIGDIRQLAGAEAYELSDGNERGVRMVRLYNAAGLEFAVAADRGMCLTRLTFRGIPLAFINSVGVVHGSYGEATPLGWLRTFMGGFSTICGLTQVGSPNIDNGEQLGIHGRAAQIPARNVSFGGAWVEGDQYQVWVEGTLRETAFFGENLTLKRRVWMNLDEPRFWIEDQVENHGFKSTPHMLLQHFNLGFPLVSSTIRLDLGKHTTQPRDAEAQKGMDEYDVFSDPIPGYQEQVFYHDLQPDEHGQVMVTLANPAFDFGRGLAVRWRYDRAHYPNLVEWKMMGEGAYVIGIEPANCHVQGRSWERENGTLRLLNPQETQDYRIEVSFS